MERRTTVLSVPWYAGWLFVGLLWVLCARVNAQETHGECYGELNESSVPAAFMMEQQQDEGADCSNSSSTYQDKYYLQSTYAPTTSTIDDVPVKTIRVNFRIIHRDDDDDTTNFRNIQAHNDFLDTNYV